MRIYAVGDAAELVPVGAQDMVQTASVVFGEDLIRVPFADRADLIRADDSAF